MVFSVVDEDYNPDFKQKNFNRNIKFLLPDMYKQARDTKPLNIIRYLVIAFLSLIPVLYLSSIKN